MLNILGSSFPAVRAPRHGADEVRVRPRPRLRRAQAAGLQGRHRERHPRPAAAAAQAQHLRDGVLLQGRRQPRLREDEVRERQRKEKKWSDSIQTFL